MAEDQEIPAGSKAAEKVGYAKVKVDPNDPPPPPRFIYRCNRCEFETANEDEIKAHVKDPPLHAPVGVDEKAVRVRLAEPGTIADRAPLSDDELRRLALALLDEGDKREAAEDEAERQAKAAETEDKTEDEGQATLEETEAEDTPIEAPKRPTAPQVDLSGLDRMNKQQLIAKAKEIGLTDFAGTNEQLETRIREAAAKAG